MAGTSKTFSRYTHTWHATIVHTRAIEARDPHVPKTTKAVVVLQSGMAYDFTRKPERLQQEWHAWKGEGDMVAEAKAWHQRYATIEDAAEETGYAAAHLRWLLKSGLVQGHKMARRG